MRLDESLPALANASCNTPLHSGMRLMGQAAKITDKTITIAKGSPPGGLAGKTLVLGPPNLTRKWFTIASSTATDLTVAEGGLEEYVPPLANYSSEPIEQLTVRVLEPRKLRRLESVDAGRVEYRRKGEWIEFEVPIDLVQMIVGSY